MVFLLVTTIISIVLIIYTVYFFAEEIPDYSDFKPWVCYITLLAAWVFAFAIWFIAPGIDTAVYTVVWEDTEGNMYQSEPEWYTQNVAEVSTFEFVEEDGSISEHGIYNVDLPQEVTYLDNDTRDNANTGTIKAICKSNNDGPYIALSGEQSYCETSYRYNDIDETDGIEE